MSKILPFVSCENPVEVRYRTSKMHVSCHHCVACDNKRQSELSTLLQVEESRSRYCNFITLTYDEDNLPIMNMDDICTYELGEIYEPNPATFRVIWDATKEFYEIAPPLKVTDRLLHSIKMYNMRRHLYQSKYSVTNACYEDNKIAILYPRDLQLFIKRLRKYIYKKYNEKVRYYAIGEYGTKSLRPHWHILLFYDSSELFSDFEDVEDLGTPSRPSPCAKFIHSLWQYGIGCTKNTDGQSYYYVSNYVNKPADFPFILEVLSPQRSFHSNFLGSVYAEEDVKEKLIKRDYESIGNYDVTDSSGTLHTLTSRWSLLSRLFPVFSGISYKDLSLLFRQYTAYPILKREIGGSVLHIAKVLRYYKHPSPVISRIQSDTALQCVMCDHSQVSLLHPLTSLLYASKKFCHMADTFGFTYVQYFELLLDVRKWKQLRQLSDLYEVLQSDKESAKLYYESLNIDSLGRSRLLNNCRDSDLYKNWLTSEYQRFSNNIKHRQIADMYKFNF